MMELVGALALSLAQAKSGRAGRDSAVEEVTCRWGRAGPSPPGAGPTAMALTRPYRAMATSLDR